MARIFLVLFVSFLASSAAAKDHGEISMDFNYQRPGADYSNFYAKNAQECAEKCVRSSRCQAFDFHQSDHSCWLKSSVYPARHYPGVVSGAKKSSYSGGTSTVASEISMQYDTQRPGGDYTQFRAGSAQECSQHCAQESRCAAFDYTTSDHYCYLKNWVPRARYYGGIISGVKGQYYPQVKAVQEALLQQRYNPGPADGLMGGKTRIALENFQRDHYLPVTGRIDDATLIALGLRQPEPSLPVVQQPPPPPVQEVQPAPTSPVQPVPPTQKIEEQKERWDSGTEQKAGTEAAMPPASAERNDQEIAEENIQDGLLLSVKAVGVTYMQLTDNIYADILARIPAGTVLQVISQKGEWYKISYQNQVGYVLAESVEKQ